MGVISYTWQSCIEETRFSRLVKMKYIMRRLKGNTDNVGNSILHIVGLKVEDRGNEAIQSPALVLRGDLHLYESLGLCVFLVFFVSFSILWCITPLITIVVYIPETQQQERVEGICSTLATLQLNSELKTAAQMFAENHAQLRMDAKEWMKSTAKNCSIVAVFIATVAFAAAYTLPGGPDQDTDYALLRKQPLFLLFTMADTVSLTLALTSVNIYLSILSSPFRLKDFKHSLPQKLLLGLTVLTLSVSMMMVAFAATVILMIRSDQEWTKIALYSVAFFPVTIFVISYVKLYKSLVRNFKQTLMKKIAALIPPCEEEPSKKGAIQ